MKRVLKMVGLMAKLGVCAVSGGSGFLGRRLLKYLEKFCEKIIILGRQPVDGYEFIRWDISEDLKPNLIGQNIDTIFHLAGYAHDTSSSTKGNIYYQCNFLATKNLYEASVKSEIKYFLFVSSAKAGGEAFDVPVNEKKLPSPAGVYGESKLAAEDYLRSVVTQKISTIILRPTLMYGPGLKGNLFKMRNAIFQGWFPRPPKNLTGLKSMVHVDDCARALIHLRNNMRPGVETYYLTDGEEYSPYDIDTALDTQLSRFRPTTPLWLLRMASKLPILKSLYFKLYGFSLYSSDKLSDTGFVCRGTIFDIDRELFK
jgi:UDP-glucose 4-epimerase